MRRIFSAAMLVLLTGSTAFAGAPKHETFINSQRGSVLDALVGGGGDAVVLNAGHLVGLGEIFQVGGIIGGGYAAKGFINAKLAVNLNFDLMQTHALIIGGDAGWENITSSDRFFVWEAYVGTRCKIVEHLYWRPTAGVKNNGKGIGFFAQLLSLSLTY